MFKGRHFNSEIITLCVRWYLTYKLSSRDLQAMMAERGISIAHTTIEGAWRRVARARAQVPRSAARRVPVSGGTAQSPAAGGRKGGV